jgi:hypothetical protein
MITGRDARAGVARPAGLEANEKAGVSSVPETRPIAIGQLRCDLAIQQRAGIDEGLVAEYAETISDWIESAPVTVFGDGSGTYIVADGFHRVRACAEADIVDIPCVVHRGTRRDALLYACGANAAHGARRTNADR